LVDIFCSLEKSVFAPGNPLIADFFHDETIILKDCELYTIGHFLPVSCIKLHILQTFDQPIGR
jgi:hypothetical protein